MAGVDVIALNYSGEEVWIRRSMSWALVKYAGAFDPLRHQPFKGVSQLMVLTLFYGVS